MRTLAGSWTAVRRVSGLRVVRAACVSRSCKSQVANVCPYANFLPDRLLLKGNDSNFGKSRRAPETVTMRIHPRRSRNGKPVKNKIHQRSRDAWNHWFHAVYRRRHVAERYAGAGYGV